MALSILPAHIIPLAFEELVGEAESMVEQAIQVIDYMENVWMVRIMDWSVYNIYVIANK